VLVLDQNIIDFRPEYQQFSHAILRNDGGNILQIFSGQKQLVYVKQNVASWKHNVPDTCARCEVISAKLIDEIRLKL